MPKATKNQIEEIHPRMTWVCKKKCYYKKENRRTDKRKWM